VKYARIIFANLLRKKVRLPLTIGSFAVAVFLFVFLGVLKIAFHFWADAAVADRLIVVNRASFFNPLPLPYEDKIRRIPGIKYITHSNWFVGVYRYGQDTFPQFAIDPVGQREVYPEFVIPDEQWQSFLKDRQGAIAGARTAERLHWKVGDRIPLVATLSDSGTWEMNLVGIYHGKTPQDDESQFWIRWDYFDQKVPSYMKGQVGWYVVRVENAADSESQVESAFAADMMKQFTNIQSLILLIGAVVFFTLVLVTRNTMAITVRERTGELAILRAIGFSNRAVLLFVIAESLITALIGSALGVLLTTT